MSSANFFTWAKIILMLILEQGFGKKKNKTIDEVWLVGEEYRKTDE